MKNEQIRKIIRKRNYGFLKLIDNYTEEIVSTVHSKDELQHIFRELYEQHVARLPITTESLTTMSANLNSRINRFLLQLPSLFSKVRKHGMNKVMTQTGQVLKVQIPTYTPVVQQLVRDNLALVKKLGETQKQQLLNKLVDGVKSGLTYNQMAKAIVAEVDGLTATRAQLIAITEVSRAHAQAQRDVMSANNITWYRWITARDRVVCDECKAFENDSPYKTSDPDSPLPVKDTHPRCRCVVIAQVK